MCLTMPEPPCTASPIGLLSTMTSSSSCSVIERRNSRVLSAPLPSSLGAGVETLIGGMRTFGELSLELLTMALPMARGIATSEWDQSFDRTPRPKAEILRAWDEDTPRIDALWKTIPAEKFHDTAMAFGQYPGTAHDLILYVIDNEIHHRGQGYVYLRSLGIAPPPFYDRS